MTGNTQPEAMGLADWLEAVGGGPSAKRCAALLREQHTRIAELESELEAVGAGGETTGATDMTTQQPEALRRSTAADGKTELFNLPGYPLMVRAVDFNRIHTESEMRRAALLDEMQKAALAAGQAVVQDDLITIRKPTTSAEMLWLLKLAHLVVSDVDKTLEETFAPAQPAVSDLPPLPAPDLRDVGTKPQEIKEFLEGYATEYARTAIAARASLSASAGSEPVAWRISCPDEPDLGFWLAEEDGGEGFLSEPLYTRTAPPAAGPDPVAYLYDDGSWTPAKTEEGRKLSNWMISAGSPKIGVLLASAAQPTRAVQATQTGNQREARPCHVFTVRKAGSLTEWAPTSMAFALPDGAHALYTLPPPPTSAEGVEHG